MFTAVPLIMLLATLRGIRRGGKGGVIRAAINGAALAFIFAFFMYSGFPFAEFMADAPWPVIIGTGALLLTNYLFYQWLKAPTLAGRRLLDEIEGFRHYLEVAEEDEIALEGAPVFNSDIYEAYLPYAIALDLENAWTARLDRAIASGLVERSYSQPGWYHSRSHHRSNFSSALASNLNSAIASVVGRAGFFVGLVRRRLLRRWRRRWRRRRLVTPLSFTRIYECRRHGHGNIFRGGPTHRNRSVTGCA